MTILVAVGIAVALSATLGRVGPAMATTLRPQAAVRLLAAASVTTALATGFILAVGAFTALAALPGIAAVGHWSSTVLASHDYVPPVAGAVAGVAVLSLLALALRYVVSSAADLCTAQSACRRLGPGTDHLVVVNDPDPDAYVLPGLRGRVIITTAMLASLPADERRALLAHEHAHLRHRHHLYIQLTELGARANPLLRPLVATVRVLVERWADEDAAVVAGRTTTARAIARAALAQHDARAHLTRHPLALWAATSQVRQRTRALLSEPGSVGTLPAIALTALVAAAPVAATVCALATEHQFELAQAALLTR